MYSHDPSVVEEVAKYVLKVRRENSKELIKNILEELKGYRFMWSNHEKLPDGCYVRYLRKSFFDTRLRFGGLLINQDLVKVTLTDRCAKLDTKCKSQRHKWNVKKIDNLIFWTTDPKLYPEKPEAYHNLKITLQRNEEPSIESFFK